MSSQAKFVCVREKKSCFCLSIAPIWWCLCPSRHVSDLLESIRNSHTTLYRPCCWCRRRRHRCRNVIGISSTRSKYIPMTLETMISSRHFFGNLFERTFACVCVFVSQCVCVNIDKYNTNSNIMFSPRERVCLKQHLNKAHAKQTKTILSNSISTLCEWQSIAVREKKFTSRLGTYDTIRNKQWNDTRA